MSVTTTSDFFDKLQETARFVAGKMGSVVPDVSVVLGTGLNNFADRLSGKTEIPYDKLPNFPLPSVVGHSGKLVFGKVGEKTILCFAGRVHAYEGYHPFQLTFAARLVALLKCKVLILTNAAGGAQKGMKPPCILLIKDHFNWQQRDPLTGVQGDPRFGESRVDLSQCYSQRLADLAQRVGASQNARIYEGAYVWSPGPTYETPTEIIAGISFGCSAFGMSTVPEVVAGAVHGLEIFAMSLITNVAAGLGDAELTHEEVTQCGKEAAPMFERFFLEMLTSMEDSTATPHAIAPAPAKPLAIAPQPWITLAGTEAQAKAATAAVVAAAGGPVSVAVFVPPEHDAILSRLSNVQKVNAGDHSLSVGKTAAGASVCVFTAASVSSWSEVETEYVLRFLADAGVGCVLSSVLAVSTGCSVHVDGAVTIITDIFHHDGLLSPLSGPYLPPTLSSLAPAAKGMGIASESAYVRYPTWPTPVEKNMAANGRCDIAGSDSLLPVEVAAKYGLPTLAIASVVGSLSGQARPGQVFDLLVGLVDAQRDAPKPSLPSFTPNSDALLRAAVSPSEKPLRTVPRCQVSQLFEYEPLQKAADALKAKFQATVCVVAHDCFDLVSQLKNASTVDVASLFSLDVALPTSTIHTGTLNNTPVYLLSAQSTLPVLDLCTVGLPFMTLRILKLAGVETVFVATSAVAASPSLSKGTVFTITDHVNITGFNPLFGPNDTRFGPRFPDMTTPYDLGLRDSLALKDTGIVAYVGSAHVGAALGRVCASLSCSAIVDKGVSEVIVARQMAMRVAAVAVVEAVSGSVAATPELADGNSRAFAEKIVSLFAAAVAK